MGLADKTRGDILEKIKEKIETITSTGGEYYFTYAGKTFLNKTSAFNSMGINITDNEDANSTVQESSLTYWNNQMDVDIDIVCPDGVSLANIYKYEADILKCIGNNLDWDGLAIDTKFISSYRNKTDQAGNKIGDLTIRIQIEYRKKAWSK